MEGGYLLGRGTYGCIFDPPLQCEEDVKRQKRSKVKMLGKITKDEDYIFEAEATKRLETIPNYRDYFVPIEMKTACKPKAVSDQKDTDIWKCQFLQEDGYDMKNMIHFQIKYGGVDSYKFICNPRQERKCSSQSEPPLHWNVFIEHLLGAGALLTLHQLVHYDIHRTNILMDAKTSKPKLIDFGQAFYADEITQETLGERWKRVDPGQPLSEFEPPEVTMATLIARKGLDAVEAYGQILRYKEPLHKTEALLGLSRQTQGREFAEFWRDSGAARSGDWVKMFQFYWPTFDAWNIGAVLLHLFQYCQMRKEIVESAEYKAAEPRFKEVLRGLLRLSPKRRLDCVEALSLWNSENKVVQSERAQTWLEARAAQKGTKESA